MVGEFAKAHRPLELEASNVVLIDACIGLVAMIVASQAPPGRIEVMRIHSIVTRCMRWARYQQ